MIKILIRAISLMPFYFMFAYIGVNILFLVVGIYTRDLRILLNAFILLLIFLSLIGAQVVRNNLERYKQERENIIANIKKKRRKKLSKEYLKEEKKNVRRKLTG
jgi:hypothetical protein